MKDTISLLQETNAGCKSATNAIERILPHIKQPALYQMVEDYNARHAKLGEACKAELSSLGANEQDPHPVSSTFAKMGIAMGASFRPDSPHLADMLADGCAMGIRSLAHYKNEFPHASASAVRLTDSLIDLEQDFFSDLLAYL